MKKGDKERCSLAFLCKARSWLGKLGMGAMSAGGRGRGQGQGGAWTWLCPAILWDLKVGILLSES